jgi:hypothetical protein
LHKETVGFGYRTTGIAISPLTTTANRAGSCVLSEKLLDMRSLHRAADLCFCLLEAPNREAVEKHHEKINLKCDWITQVESAA